MFSIGELSRRTKVKVPTIRYYEGLGLLPEPERTDGNQRRFGRDGLERLTFVRHARDLGFSLDAIRTLIALQDHPDRSCQSANSIAVARLDEVREKIEKLRRLESELQRISDGCDGSGASGDCYVLAALSDHALCDEDH